MFKNFNPFKRKIVIEEIIEIKNKEIIPVFDKRYQKVIYFQYTDIKSYIEIIDWVNKNTKQSVDIKQSSTLNSFYIAFEDVNDALMFRIKYGC
jgi:DNA polymerase III delta prime subunit